MDKIKINPERQKQKQDEYGIKFNGVISSDVCKRQVKELLDAARLSPSSGGRQNTIKYLSGDMLSARQSIISHCFDCSGGYVDGRNDCEVPWCSLYPFMPYGKMKKQRYIRPERRNEEK